MLLFSDSSENNRESFWVKDTDPSRKGRKAERTAGSNADAGYKLARSFRCISLIIRFPHAGSLHLEAV